MKWTLCVLPLLVVAGVTVYTINQRDSRPEYVGKAESRLASYLGVTHGPGHCKAAAIANEPDHWNMACLSEKGEVFAYDLYPPEKAPYSVADGFYLVAKNKLAIISANEGLTEYLKIDTGNSTE